jgi:hypothetical protein
MKTNRWFTRSNPLRPRLRIAIAGALVVASAAIAFVAARPSSAVAQSGPTYNINTLAGKVASLKGTAGLAIRFSAFIEQEAGDINPLTPDGPTLTNGGAGSSVLAPDITVNQDTLAGPQNETAIAVDPNNPNRIVTGANDYVTITWSCMISGTPCSALGDGYSGTYYSNNSGSTWCCLSSDPQHLGTLIPGVEHLAGGPYDAGGDPSVAFDSQGHVYYAGLGFDRTSPPNTVAVNKGTFDGTGKLTWGPPTFINQTTAPSTLNDKSWIAVDANPTSPFRDRIYVTWTRFLFSAGTGAYVQSPIAVAFSKDGGQTFSTPQLIVGNVLYGQGSRPLVGPDGTVYVFWDGSTRHAALDSTYMVKSTDGGATWSKPLSISTLADIPGLRDTAFRVNSYPAAAAAPNGDLYVTWNTEVKDTATTFGGDADCASFIPGNHVSQCHSVAVYSKSTDGGATWSAPALAFTPGNRTAVDYPVTQPAPSADCTAAQGCDGSIFSAPSPTGPVEDVFPAVTVAPNGTVYLAAYRGDVVAPWQSCLAFDTSVFCTKPGPYVNNTKLDYVVNKLGTAESTLTTQPINTRYQFRGGFIGDYTDIAAGSDNTYHAFWTDTNNTQTVDWWAGTEFVPNIRANQQDVVVRSGGP